MSDKGSLVVARNTYLRALARIELEQRLRDIWRSRHSHPRIRCWVRQTIEELRRVR